MSFNKFEPARGPRWLTRRRFLALSAMVGVAAALPGCGSSEPSALPATDLLNSGETIPLDVLIAEAKREGWLSTMSLPHDWANYGEIISTFREKYAIGINELNPQGSSTDEIEAVRTYKDNPGPFAPDVLDIGLGFAEASKADGLLAPYKVATWNTIPEGLKDPEGYWCCNYYGVLSFAVNTDLVKTVPQDWADLLKPEYKGMVALSGNPTASSQAVNSVWAAGLSRTDALDDAPQAGLEFFAELHKLGNFVPQVSSSEMLVSGQAPITIMWDYLALNERDKVQDQAKIEVVVPQRGVFGVPYVQAISAYTPHPFVARLWTEFVFSDEGQLLWLEGYAHPIRYNDLVRTNRVPADLSAKLPPAELYASAVFPTSASQTDLAKQVITEQWMQQVGVAVKAAS